MPRKKGWRKAGSKVTDCERRKTGKYDIESPEQMKKVLKGSRHKVRNGCRHKVLKGSRHKVRNGSRH